MFDRLIALIGLENFKKIGSKKVLVLGIGGVGGYTVEALVRSGITNITIIDGDIVDPTNLNRQIIALHSTIGKSKVEVMKERLLDINPEVQVKCRGEYLEESSIASIVLEEYDYVVDALDDVKVKVALIKYSIEHSINLITSTGTAKKMCPEKLEIVSLDKTSYDPLAKKLRQELRGYDIKKVKTLASKEEPVIDGPILGSTAFVPSTGGLLIASYIIRDILK